MQINIYKNQIAQLNARYILFNTNEDKENFPNYKLKEDNLTLLGFQYLNLGCRLAAYPGSRPQ